MSRICLPHTELPGTSALFRDYVYHFDRVSQFYEHPPFDTDSLVRAARSVVYPDARREKLVAALRAQNGDNPSLDLLELPETVAVVTGQQVGLFSGPAYTMYKALTAVRIARQLSGRGVRAVPVFWLATEDHDFAEVNQVHVFDVVHRPVELNAVATVSSGQPAGGAVINQVPLGDLRDTFEGFIYRDEILDLVEQTYRPGQTFGDAFSGLVRRLLAGYGLIFVDPMAAQIRHLAAPLLRDALEQAPALSEALMARNEELRVAGYHAQVYFEPHTSLFFRLEDSMRRPLRRHGGDYYQETRRLSHDELAAEPEKLSPNALLRPVMQDYLLPTAAYVGGPAELAYLAQSQVIYRMLLGRMPVACPRAGFTILDERSQSLLEKYRFHPRDCFSDAERLKDRIAARLIPADLDRMFEHAGSTVRVETTRLEEALRTFDPTLAEAMTRSRAKMLYQVEKVRRKTAREALRREQRVEDAAAHLGGLIFPNRHLQERYYSLLPFLAKHGLELVDRLYEEIQNGCPDHLVVLP